MNVPGSHSHVTVPGYRSLQLEPLFALDVMAQCMPDRNALRIVGRLEQSIEVRLLRDGDRDGGLQVGRKHELCDYLDRNKTRSILFYLVAYCAI
jgi:hypothetical protein